MYTTVYTGGYTSALDFDYRYMYNSCAQLGKDNHFDWLYAMQERLYVLVR